MATSIFSRPLPPVPDLIPGEPYERRRDVTFNPPREPGKHEPKTWPEVGAREGATDRHEFVWELPDGAYNALRYWVARVEAGDPAAVALAQEREIRVVVRNPPGKRDAFLDPEDVLFRIGDALYSGIFDDPEDRDNSEAAHKRRYDLRTKVADGIIHDIFGDGYYGMVSWILEECYEAQGETCYQMGAQWKRAEMRLQLGIANKRDHAIDAMGPDYWD
ncbi:MULTISPECIES: hypothetical protein [unclassified Methylobacterium]|uniref:hypothetical protein n=1 Tax=unclassified Methylobacterium TaxID=2615210 RepID=UPI0011C1FE25|nr:MULTISPECIES: hypothetical protein [unclassified Methylobacterium]QEE39918.1 hypothetical protein FVA80_14090 [Methylobacterium sp. WL1]TXN56584.1 hypothetical protein FV241_14745 [Methylobacterium sp. WL2]